MLDSFPNHKYRYIDQTGQGRPPVSSNVVREDLNKDKYEAYFTVNGFDDCNDNTKEQCTNLNAFFIDIDGRKDWNEIEEIKKILEPTFVTETMNGYHCYWLLDEPIYKAEVENWEEIVASWEKIELSIVNTLKSDPKVKDITRILRQPETIYWKKTDGKFKITGRHKQLAKTYTMETVSEAFPFKETALSLPTLNKVDSKRSEAEKKDFFDRVYQEFPMEERDSFQKLISGKPDTLPKGVGERNNALLVTATLMRQAGWTKARALAQIEKVGWHGLEKERGGSQEILTTINSAFNGKYIYSTKNDLISHNMSDEEEMRLQQAYAKALKDRKEHDKVRYSNYEQEILVRNPYLRKNETGIFYNYSNGVYKEVSDQQMSDMILTGLYDDMLWSYRTNKSVSDKTACLQSIVPNLVITDDGGFIANVKNGLLNIYTRELRPHTPEFVSLIQYDVSYDPTATCPTWTDCMEAWMEGDEKEEKSLMLQQFAGYCLSSSMQKDKALFMVGDGANGKSTFVDTIAMLIGKDGVTHVDLEGLYGQYGMKALVGKRLNVIEEVHGNYYQSNKLKKLVSGEPVTIDVKYKDQYTFTPQAKFIFAVNQMPRVDDTSNATERRICAVTFKNNFRDKPNTELRSRFGLLAKELPGILNWMLDGAKNLSDSKTFIITKEQKQMLSEYRQENSSVEGFIGECLEYKEGDVITSRDLYEKYKEFCQRDGRKFKANIVFTKEMRAYCKKHGEFSFIERTSGHNTARFEGIAIATGWTNHLTRQENEAYGDFNQAF